MKKINKEGTFVFTLIIVTFIYVITSINNFVSCVETMNYQVLVCDINNYAFGYLILSIWGFYIGKNLVELLIFEEDIEKGNKDD